MFRDDKNCARFDWPDQVHGPRCIVVGPTLPAQSLPVGTIVQLVHASSAQAFDPDGIVRKGRATGYVQVFVSDGVDRPIRQVNVRGIRVMLREG